MIPLLRWMPMDDTARGILIIVAVMPSAMVSALFSERYGGDTDFIAGGLLLTHLWALVTVPLFLAWAL
jgi:predicted permease